MKTEAIMVYKSFDQMLEKVKAKPKMSVVAVVGAAEAHVIDSVLEAEKMGIIKPVLIGDAEKIKSIIAELGGIPGEYKIVQADSNAECGKFAVELIKRGEADFL